MFASIIIPVWRDAAVLEEVLEGLPPGPDVEVVVAPVLGDEQELARLLVTRPDLRWTPAPRGRAVQMNAGAAAARGRWLLFLHADSRLPANWIDVLRAADREGAAGGSFRFALDGAGWRPRMMERGVRLRVRLLGLPYGDQALFVRRDVFEALGGYRDWPLMEDVDLVLRLKKAGRLHHSAEPVVTSARRWTREGWLARSLSNMALAARFFLGTPPARLAQRYFGRHARAVVLVGRAPWVPGKTRLAAADADAHAELRQALFLDTLDAVRSVPQAQHIVACEPPDAVPALRRVAGGGADVIPQRGAGLGERLDAVFEDVFRLGAEHVVVIGSDLPDLPPRVLAGALSLLESDPARVAVGPARDGGYYLIGMSRPHPILFKDIDWSTPRVLDQTLAAARAHGIDYVLLEPWHDVDDAGDLARLAAAQDPSGAVRTRRWIQEHGGR